MRKIMIKKMIGFFLASSVFLYFNAHAANPNVPDPVTVKPVKNSGFYVSGQLGWGWTNTGELFDGFIYGGKSKHSVHDDGLAGRLAAGYNFNKYLGLEIGTSKWSDATSKWTDSDSSMDTIYTTVNERKIKTAAIDLLGKLNYRFDNGFGLFLKGGVADVFTHRNESYRRYDNKTSDVYRDKNNSFDNIWLPEVSVGVSYQLNKRWAVDMAYTKIYSSIGAAFGMPDNDMATLGLTYNFL